MVLVDVVGTMGTMGVVGTVGVVCSGKRDGWGRLLAPLQGCFPASLKFQDLTCLV